jgi:hypothetical protein
MVCRRSATFSAIEEGSVGELEQTFPRWLGPVVGAAIGAALGLRASKADGAIGAAWLVGGALLGTVVGGVLWLIDASPPPERRPPTLMGSSLAVLALFPGCVPFVGLVFGFPVFVINQYVAGWQTTASRLGLGLGVVMAVVAFVATQLPRD